MALGSPFSRGSCLHSLAEMGLTVAEKMAIIEFLQKKKGFLMAENGLVSSMEVWHAPASGSAVLFGEKPTRSLGEVKREAALEDKREAGSDIRPCLLLTDLDLFRSTIP